MYVADFGVLVEHLSINFLEGFLNIFCKTCQGVNTVKINVSETLKWQISE